jgi:hypothetical protein
MPKLSTWGKVVVTLRDFLSEFYQPGALTSFLSTVWGIVSAKDITYTKECVEYLNATGFGRFSARCDKLPFSKFIDVFYEGKLVATYKRWMRELYFPILHTTPRFLSDGDFEKYYKTFLLLGCLGIIVYAKLEQLYPDAFLYCDFHYDTLRATGRREIYFGITKFSYDYQASFVVFLPSPPATPDLSNYDVILRAYLPSRMSVAETLVNYEFIAKNGVTPKMLALLLL